jgi:DNA polymerase
MANPLNFQNMGNLDPSKQLVENLKAENLIGLPAEWFTKKGESQEGSPVDHLAKGSIEIDRSNIYAEKNFDELFEAASHCTKCRLCETRNRVVFGVGDRSARLVFVGEGPGADEDAQGEPFVGRAGQLLTAAIKQGMGLTREQVYICNVVKCRPPENRAPQPDEVASCISFLQRQLELINPQVIVTLGQHAQKALVGSEIGITKLRGNWQSWRGIKVMPTLHPAYLLRNPPAKKDFWADLQVVMDELGLKRPR